MSGLEQISVKKNGKTVTKFIISYDETTKHEKTKRSKKPEQVNIIEETKEVKLQSKDKTEPLKIIVTTEKEKTTIFAKSKTPYALISKGRLVKTTVRNKNKFYPANVYIFKKNAQGDNYLYLETLTDDGKKFLKKLFKTEFDELNLSCEKKTETVGLGTKFTYKRGAFKIEYLGKKSE